MGRRLSELVRVLPNSCLWTSTLVHYLFVRNLAYVQGTSLICKKLRLCARNITYLQETTYLQEASLIRKKPHLFARNFTYLQETLFICNQFHSEHTS